jgi:Protein of unknown function (DUF1292)
MDDDAASVTLLDEEGVERRFLLHDAFDAEGHTFYVVEAEDDPDQVLLLKETEGLLESVDGEEFDRILALLETDGSDEGGG